MGEVIVELKLENTIDRGMVRRRKLKEKEVRKVTTKAIADSGAATLVLPQDMVEELGLEILGNVVVEYAHKRTEERPLAGPVTVRIGKRATNVDCIVGQPASEVLLGQIPLEAMDLLVDCGQRALIPRPESPFLPLYKIR